MNKMNWVATAAAVAWLSASGAFAAVVLSENFEGLADDAQLFSQLGTFESVGQNPTAGTAPLLTGQDYGSGAPDTGFNGEGGDTAIFFDRSGADNNLNLRLKQDADFDLGAAYDGSLAHAISFDFYIQGSLPSNDLNLLLADASGGLADDFQLAIMNGFGRVRNRESGGSYTVLNPGAGNELKVDTWYRYELLINPLNTASDTYDLTVTESGGGTVVSATDVAFRTDIADIARMEFQMFNNNPQTATVFFDNISVTNSLPEGVIPPVFIDEHFTAAEGYTAGPLANGWGGDHVADFTVDPTGTGTVSLPTNSVGFKRAVYQTALTSNTIYKAGAEFSFSRDNSTPTKNAGLISVEISELNTIGAGNGRIAMQLERFKNFPGQFYLKLIDQNGTSAFPASGSFNETKMGIDTNSALSASDDLGLYFEIVRGATSNDWSGTGTLSNLTAGTEVKSFEFTFDTSAAYFNDDSLYPVLGSLNSETDHFCLDRTVDRFTASSTPKPGVGAPQTVEFIASEGYESGQLAGQLGYWSGDAGNVVDATTNHVELSSTGDAASIYALPISATNSSITVGAEYRFDRTATFDTTTQKKMLHVLLEGPDGNNVRANLQRFKDDPTRYEFGFSKTSDGNAWKNEADIAESALGLDGGTSPDSSDLLGITMTVNPGTTVSNWSASVVLSNLTAGTEVKRISVAAGGLLSNGPNPEDTTPFTVDASWLNADLNSGFRSLNSDAHNFVSNREIETFWVDYEYFESLYLQWAAGKGLFGADAEMAADPDGDGANNLNEYGLGGDPNDPSDTGITSTDVAGNLFNFMHVTLADPESGVSYLVETTDDLVFGTWETNGITTVPGGYADPAFDSATNSISMDGETQGFMRVRVIED